MIDTLGDISGTLPKISGMRTIDCDTCITRYDIGKYTVLACDTPEGHCPNEDFRIATFQLLGRYSVWGVKDPEKELHHSCPASVLLAFKDRLEEGISLEAALRSQSPVGTLSLSYSNRFHLSDGAQMLGGNLAGILQPWCLEQSAEMGRLALDANYPRLLYTTLHALGISGALEAKSRGKDVIFKLMQPYLGSKIQRELLPGLVSYEDHRRLLDRNNPLTRENMMKYWGYFLDNSQLTKILLNLINQSNGDPEFVKDIVTDARKGGLYQTQLIERFYLRHNADLIMESVDDGPAVYVEKTDQMILDLANYRLEKRQAA
jgi:hypothetical protein